MAVDKMEEPRPTVGLADEPDAPDREQLLKTRHLFSLFANTISGMKIYPSNHENVLRLQAELYARLNGYLEEYNELEVSVAEDAFLLDGQPVFREENVVKGLPYLFFKDGMQKLAFVRGLGRAEFDEFLEIVKMDAMLPAGESDIVDSLWELDFEHFRYFAPDEFLESKIAAGQARLYDFKIDRTDLHKGRIDLDETDRSEFAQKLPEIDRLDRRNTPGWAEVMVNLDRSDAEQLEALLSLDRRQSPEAEFLELLYEILFLEDQIPRFIEILALLDAHHKYLLGRNDFAHAVQFVDMMSDLEKALAEPGAARAKAVETFLRDSLKAVPLADLRAQADPEHLKDPVPYFEYLRRLGPAAIPIGAEVYEANHQRPWREAGLAYLRGMAGTHLDQVIALAQERKPLLTKAIIEVLGSLADKKAVLQLAAFVHYRNPEIKVEAVRALGAAEGELARRVLLEFLQDPDEDVRVVAAKVLRLAGEPRGLGQLLKLVAAPSFREKSSAEKKAFLGCLGRSGEADATAALRSILLKRTFFRRARTVELRLAAAAALEGMGLAEALEALRQGARASNKAVAEACARALENKEDIPAAPEEGKP